MQDRLTLAICGVEPGAWGNMLPAQPSYPAGTLSRSGGDFHA